MKTKILCIVVLILSLGACGFSDKEKENAKIDQQVFSNTYYSTQRDKLVGVAQELGDCELQLSHRLGVFTITLSDFDNIIVHTRQFADIEDDIPDYFSILRFLATEPEKEISSQAENKVLAGLFNSLAANKTTADEIGEFLNDRSSKYEITTEEYQGRLLDWLGMDESLIRIKEKGEREAQGNYFSLVEMSEGNYRIELCGLKSTNSDNTPELIQLVNRSIDKLKLDIFDFYYEDTYELKLKNEAVVRITFSSVWNINDIDIKEKDCNLVVSYDQILTKKSQAKKTLDSAVFIQLVNALSDLPIKTEDVEKVLKRKDGYQQIRADSVSLSYLFDEETMMESLFYVDSRQ